MNQIRQWAVEHRYASGVGAALLVLLVLVTLLNFFAGLPEAKEPATSLFYNPNPARWESEATADPVSAEFSVRPLFSSTRRMKVAPPSAPPPPKPLADTPVSTLDGWSLLGIFDSGEVKGALVRHANGEGHRISMGDVVDGWRLVAVDPRLVRFESVSGALRAELGMTLATVEVLPVPADTQSKNESLGDDSNERSEPPEEPEEPELVTFKGYYGGPPSEED